MGPFPNPQGEHIMTTTTVENEPGKSEAVQTDDQAQQAQEIAKPAEKPAGADAGTDNSGETEKPEIDWKAAARKHEDRWKSLTSEVDDLKKQLETANSAAGRVTELEAQASAAEKRAERAEIAAEVATAKGVKLRYLTGETREEIEASADEVLADFRSMAKIGVVPTQGTGDPAPRTSSYESGAERARAQFDTKKEGQ